MIRSKMESTEILQALADKLQVVDKVPKVIERLQFGILSVDSSLRCSLSPNDHVGPVKIL